MYETGGMRRLHLRGRNNALKRLLIQGAAFNLGLVMRKVLGVGTPRGLKDLMAHILAFIEPLSTFWSAYRPSSVLVGRLVRLLKRLRPLVSPALSSHVAA
jgi:transposase